MGKLIVSLSPHAHGNESVEKNMYGVIIALVPAILFISSVWVQQSYCSPLWQPASSLSGQLQNIS